MELEKVRLTGAQETTLATLYGKAMESRRPDSILEDIAADTALGRIDYDFNRLKIRRTDHTSLAVRAKAYDVWARQFLATPSGLHRAAPRLRLGHPRVPHRSPTHRPLVRHRPSRRYRVAAKALSTARRRAAHRRIADRSRFARRDLERYAGTRHRRRPDALPARRRWPRAATAHHRAFC